MPEQRVSIGNNEGRKEEEGCGEGRSERKRIREETIGKIGGKVSEREEQGSLVRQWEAEALDR